MQESADYVHDHKAELMASAGAAVMQKIMAHEGAQKAMATTIQQMSERASTRETTFRPGAGVPNDSATPG